MSPFKEENSSSPVTVVHMQPYIPVLSSCVYYFGGWWIMKYPLFLHYEREAVRWEGCKIGFSRALDAICNFLPGECYA